ncbi:E3 ubiquitin-protein ligase ATL42 [Platanthera zijinensis]|uniref:RING-type E3 ubiquitin transferase n=1 Tax=Platanthera zijinensis TaxID=2320716 RepID=A0AAP0BSP9_9ASPA
MKAVLLTILVLLTTAGAAAQPVGSDPGNSTDNNVQISFRPSIAVVIGIFSVMFSLTFLLLMYAKFCHSSTTSLLSTTGAIFAGIGNGETGPEEGRSSGIDKAVIESLPFFRFSALKGSRDGLECAVCLSRFDDAEMLRLLPRCKHAFHIDCIDRWLDSHSSCPLCRTRVDVDDIAFFKFSTSSRRLQKDPSGRFNSDPVEQGGDSGLELYIERDHGVPDGASSRKLHNYKHRVIVSDAVFRSRWSDFNSADLISLDSEMLRVMSSKRFDHGIGNAAADVGGSISPEGVTRIKGEMERKRRLESRAVQMQIVAENSREYSSEYGSGDMRSLISPAGRCMSDITEVSRYRASASHGGKEEKVRQMWLPIARRTVQLFAGKQRRSMLPPLGTLDGKENV